MNREVHVRICESRGVKFPRLLGDLDPVVYDEMTTVLTEVLSEHGAPDAVVAEIGELLVRDRASVLNAAPPARRTVTSVPAAKATPSGA